MRGQGTDWRRIDRKDAANFFACYFTDVICGDPRLRTAFLQSLDDPQSHRHTNVGANQRFLELVPVDRFAGKSVDDVLKKFHAQFRMGRFTESPGRLRAGVAEIAPILARDDRHWPNVSPLRAPSALVLFEPDRGCR